MNHISVLYDSASQNWRSQPKSGSQSSVKWVAIVCLEIFIFPSLFIKFKNIHVINSRAATFICQRCPKISIFSFLKKILV